MPNCTKCGEFINTSVTWVTVCRFCQAGGVFPQPAPVKPTAAQDSVAMADAYLVNAVLPTYSALIAALRAHDALSLKVDPEGLFAGLETIRARSLLARHDKTMSGDFK